MPFSSQSGKSYISALNLQAKTVLDIGAGSGTYRKLFPNLGTHWTAVEVWDAYVEKYSLGSLYDEVIVSDIRSLELNKEFDVCFVGDILEHMTAEEAAGVLKNLRAHCKTIVVSIPLGHYPQDEYDGNPYEKHVVDNWTHEQFISVFGTPSQYCIDNEIGVYVYKKLKIAVYAISKNESEFVERFCKSAGAADMILIADTGSTDNTVELAKANGADVFNIHVSPWRFDKARDAALALIPKDYDVCISLDLDEIMEPGWRQEIERVWKAETTRLRYKFDWGCGISFYYEKIHHRNGYHWHHPVHEYPRPDGRINEIYAHTDMLLVSHHPDPTKSRGQYLDLLKLAVTEDPHCPRNAFYYARELTFYSKWVDAVVALNKYLENPEATWPNERCYAMRLLGKAYDALGDKDTALIWYKRATVVAPNTREPWHDLAMAQYMKSNWAECLQAAEAGLAIKTKELVYTCDPRVWEEPLPDLASIAAWNLGQTEKALDYCDIAAKIAPSDVRIANNLKMMQQDALPQAA